MSNPLLGQVLGSVLGAAMGRRGMPGGMGAGMRSGMGGGLGGAALGGILGGMLGKGGMRAPAGGRPPLGGNRAALMMMLLPLVMRWVERNGGIGAVLKKFQQKGYDRQAKSWMSTGPNDGIDEQAVEQVVGQGELAQMAQRLGVPEEEVAQALAEIMPEMVDKLSPQGQIPPQADDVLLEGADELEREIDRVQKQPH
jgi:uncharacterized protein YidB (DUF937 family)